MPKNEKSKIFTEDGQMAKQVFPNCPLGECRFVDDEVELCEFCRQAEAAHFNWAKENAKTLS